MVKLWAWSLSKQTPILFYQWNTPPLSTHSRLSKEKIWTQPCYSNMLIGAFRGVEDRVYRWIGGFRTSCFILPRFSWRLNAEASWSILILPNKTQLFLALSTPLLLLSVFVSSPTSCVTDTDKTVSYAWTFMRGTLHRLTQFMMNCLQL